METRDLLSGSPPAGNEIGDANGPDSAALTVFPVQATVETADDVFSADDPAIWIHPTDTAQSLVIATDKSTLRVYDLAGNELQVLNDGEMNNVDLRYNFHLAGESVALVAATNRTNDTVTFYKVDEASRQLVLVGSIDPNFNVYGLGMYHSAATGKFYVFVNAKSGVVQQLEVFDNGSGQLAATLVRTFDIGTQPEGLVADDQLGFLYAGEEDLGVWKYGAEPDAGDARTLVDDVSSGNLVADVEGLAIYYASDATGYLLVSSQGSDSFAIYTREGDNQYIDQFNIVAGNDIDAVTVTDGIDVTNFPLGDAFPQGMFIAQDNDKNFKLVPWQSIATGANPALAIDTQYDPRIGGPPPPPVEPVTVSFQDGVDSYSGTRDARLRSNYDTINFGSTKTLGVDSEPESASLIRWDLEQIPLGSTVQSVSVALNVTDPSVDTFEVYALKRNWSEAEATWNQASLATAWSTAGANGVGDRDTTVLATVSASALGIHEITLNANGIAAVQGWIDHPGTNFGLAVLDYLAANDGLTFSSSETAADLRPKITITYLPPGVQNQAPLVDAGRDAQISIGLSATLDGTVSDDGLPQGPASLSTLWSEVSGPGNVEFADAAAIDTSVSFSQPGTYVLRLSADDGELSASDDVTLTIDGDTPSVVFIEAENFQLRNNTSDHAWWIVNGESPGVSAFTGATGPYIQSLTDAGLDSGRVNAIPMEPFVEFEVSVSPGAVYALDLLSAGLSTAGDSVWVQVPTGTLASAEGNSVGPADSLVTAMPVSRFDWRNAGQWNLAAGQHTIRISMRESGAAVDALRLERLAAAPVALAELLAAQPTSSDRVPRPISGRSHDAIVVFKAQSTSSRLVPEAFPSRRRTDAEPARGLGWNVAALNVALADSDSLDELISSALR